ncbi:MAG: toxin-antitoxin system HicB family antitoxin [Pseudonocardia sp.]|nr:toxin-antitoxin system HicB family antitoxin [Pseudonocardia sp.]
MDLSQYVSQLREDLSSAAAAGDDQTRRTAALLGAAIEPAARLALMNALSDLAAEVTAALDDRVVEVRLDGRDVRVSVSGEPAVHNSETAPERAPSPFAGFGGSGFGGSGFGGADAGDISRITLRLVEQIKGQAEQAAAAQGVSLNSWVAQAVQGALAGGGAGRRHGRRGEWGGGPGRGDAEGRRIRGWVQG